VFIDLGVNEYASGLDAAGFEHVLPLLLMLGRAANRWEWAQSPTAQ
jgi:hypothetical protein